MRKYDDHDEGIAGFCEGKVLYYVGDYDIIRRKVRDMTKSKCPAVIERFTRTKEVYGVFFRAGFRNGAMGNGANVDCRRGATIREDASTDTPCSDEEDVLLYTVFNHTLLRMMQADIDILEFEYDREFGAAEKSVDLQAFFENYRIAADMRR